jgi:hypothetical protein
MAGRRQRLRALLGSGRRDFRRLIEARPKRRTGRAQRGDAELVAGAAACAHLPGGGGPAGALGRVPRHSAAKRTDVQSPVVTRRPVACLWGLEWLVLAKTPDANIRVDLLLIWPLIGIATLWAWVRAVRGWWSAWRQRRGR